MTFKKLLLIPLLAALPAVTGCGSDCKSACEDRNDCPGVTKVDCDKTCDDAEKQAKDIGCEDQYDDFIDCAADQDACKADANACAKETEAFFTCACKAQGVSADQCTFD